MSAARNRGARLARGALVGFLDHDDVWSPTKLERQLEALKDPAATLALCAVDVVDERGTVRATKRLRARTDLLTGMLTFDGTETVSCSSTGLVRREESCRWAASTRPSRCRPTGTCFSGRRSSAPSSYVDERARSLPRARREHEPRHRHDGTRHDPRVRQGVR